MTAAAWLRLRRARQLPGADDFGARAAVAEAVGFASVQHFRKVYAERFGRRPSNYHASKN